MAQGEPTIRTRLEAARHCLRGLLAACEADDKRPREERELTIPRKVRGNMTSRAKWALNAIMDAEAALMAPTETPTAD
jgi:hypothetical protein